MIVGYARVSTSDQNLDGQLTEVEAHGCKRIFTGNITDTSTARAGLADILEFVRDGNTLVVVRLDRFARSLCDLDAMLERLKGGRRASPATCRLRAIPCAANRWWPAYYRAAPQYLPSVPTG